MTLSTSKPFQQARLLLNGDRTATWADYVVLRDQPGRDRLKISFNRGWLWVDMGKEGINHARFCDLITMLIVLWSLQFPEESIESCGRCLIEKPDTQACAPDVVIYKGGDYPRWETGKPRLIDLTRHRLPDLVGEISDTTLAQDLDEQKRLYAELGIAEYWVVDVKGQRVFIFRLNAAGEYEQVEESQVLDGVSVALLEQVLDCLDTETNTAAAGWFAQQLRITSE